MKLRRFTETGSTELLPHLDQNEKHEGKGFSLAWSISTISNKRNDSKNGDELGSSATQVKIPHSTDFERGHEVRTIVT